MGWIVGGWRICLNSIFKEACCCCVVCRVQNGCVSNSIPSSYCFMHLTLSCVSSPWHYWCRLIVSSWFNVPMKCGDATLWIWIGSIVRHRLHYFSLCRKCTLHRSHKYSTAMPNENVLRTISHSSCPKYTPTLLNCIQLSNPLSVHVLWFIHQPSVFPSTHMLLFSCAYRSS